MAKLESPSEGTRNCESVPRLMPPLRRVIIDMWEEGYQLKHQLTITNDKHETVSVAMRVESSERGWYDFWGDGALSEELTALLRS